MCTCTARDGENSGRVLFLPSFNFSDYHNVQQYDIIILGGLSGRLDQTISTIAYLYKLRKIRNRVFAVTDDNIGWVLDSVFILLDISPRPIIESCNSG